MAVLLVLAGTVATAQRAPLRSSIELTVVTATVRDAGGRLVKGLPREAFEVYEDGVRLPIAQFTNERVPLGLGLLLDTSDSMFGRRIKDAQALVRSDAFVYAIAIDTPEPQAIAKRVNVETLNEITGQSGGCTEVVRATADLEPATSRIAEELNSQYVLAYASPHPGDGKYHTIRVRTTEPTHRVRARNGYVAARRGSQ